MRNDLILNKADLPKELKLLLLILQNENMGDVFSNHEDWPATVNWAVFLQFIRHHRVGPTLYARLKKIEEKWMPAYVVQEVRRDYHNNTFHMLHLSGEMEYVCKLLTDHNIQVLLLKGPVLAADLYGELSRRTSSDLDMLIPIHDLDKAHELLTALNYVKEDYFSMVLNDWKWRHHHVTYFHPEKRIKLEIHWRLHPGPSWEPSFHELWERKRRSSITSDPVYILGKEDLFVFLVAHGARHGWSRLRWLVDIDRIVSQNPNWGQIQFLLRKFRLLQVGGQALHLTSALLGTPLTQGMGAIAAGKRSKRLAQEALFYLRQMINLHSEPVPDDVVKYHKRHLISLMSNQQKLLHLLSLLYPYPMDAETMPLPKRLHFLYFPLRPFLSAWRKIRKLALP